MSRQPLTTAKKAYFGSLAITPLPSILLYVLSPAGTVKFFGGVPSPSSRFWCSIAASGDALVSYLAWYVLLSGGVSREIEKLVVRGTAIYAMFHFGGFFFWHLRGEEPHPMGPAMYVGGLAGSLAGLIAWGL